MAIGVAPEADLFSGLVIEGGQVLLRVLAGMEWCLEQNVRILSMSLGIRGFTPFAVAVTQRLRQQGILPVFAIGNEGPNTSRSPGNYSECISVGAVNSKKRMADFSSSIVFSRPDEPNQPNVVAPGVGIISAKTGGGSLTLDGTSMATPHVAGLAALLFQAKPDATIDEIETAILGSCEPLKKDDISRFGKGSVHGPKALAILLGN
jgi:subtilisin family serine protease